jgi:hypothetical protein
LILLRNELGLLFDASGLVPSELKIGEMVCNDGSESSMVTSSSSDLIFLREFAGAL